jgi:arsenite methyltransferase
MRWHSISKRAGRCTTIALVVAIGFAPAFGQEHDATVHHRFTDVQKSIAAFESPDRAGWQKPDEVIKALGLKPGDSIADIGAGTGYFARRLAKAVGPLGTVLALDVEPAMVDHMKADAAASGLGDYRPALVKPDDPGLAPRSVDLIFFCDSLHHVDNRVVYLRNLIPSLKSGGRVVDIDFKEGQLPVGPPPGHKLSQAKVMGEFEQAGYRLVRKHDFLPYQYFLEFEPRSGASEPAQGR